MRTIHLFVCMFVLTAPLGAINVQDLPNVSYQAIPFKQMLPPGFSSADPYAVSNSGVVVGNYEFSAGSNPDIGGFTYTNGVLTQFAFPQDSSYILARGINNAGVIILSAPQSSVGFVGKPGAFTPVSFPGATQISLNAINDAGVVVGSYLDANSTQHGFIYRPDGTYASFDGPFTGASGTQLTGINNLGDIVGVSASQPFIFTNGSFDTSLFGPRPAGINDNEQILFPDFVQGRDDILDYKSNTLEAISVSGIPPGSGNYGINPNQGSINNSGVIAGGDAGGGTGYLLIPTPEPATFMFVLPVFAGVVFLAQRRRRQIR